VRYCVEHLLRRDLLASGVEQDGQAAIAHALDPLGQAFGGAAQAGIIRRPDAGQLELNAWPHGRLLILAATQTDGREQGAGN
jgi:hypothetical protein